MFNASLLLTFVRLFASPFLIPLLVVYLVPADDIFINLFVSLFFILLSLTDFFDGYLARLYGFETVLGSLLDPVADKVLLLSALVSLLAINKINVFWVILFLSREFFVMGLRILVSSTGYSVSVSQLARYKTTFQMLYVTSAIFNPYQSLGLDFREQPLAWLNVLEVLLLTIALLLSWWSAWRYFYPMYRRLRKLTQ